MSYPGWNQGTWELFDEVELELKLVDYSRGRSAIHFNWEDTNGHRFPMFASDMVDLVKGANMKAGVVKGVWTAAKRGSNYGIKFLRNVEG